MFSGLESPTHWLVLLAVVLIVLGPKRLPDAGRALGEGMRGFRDSLSGRDDDRPADDADRRAS
jgi:sec-independent protein translocase protein TatA